LFILIKISLFLTKVELRIITLTNLTLNQHYNNFIACCKEKILFSLSKQSL
jgi:hypothetical protein